MLSAKWQHNILNVFCLSYILSFSVFYKVAIIPPLPNLTNKVVSWHHLSMQCNHSCDLCSFFSKMLPPAIPQLLLFLCTQYFIQMVTVRAKRGKIQIIKCALQIFCIMWYVDNVELAVRKPWGNLDRKWNGGSSFYS